jgi:two-component system OmpR family response regulator
MINILMVEDDTELASIIQRYLLPYNIKVSNVVHGFEAVDKLIASHSYDLLILDLTLPDIDGLELIVKLRKISQIPIIISSARDDLLDKVMGLERGADDYLAKPYNPRELEARIKSIVRREQLKDKPNNTINGVFIINEQNHTITLKNQELQLTLAQFDILKLLIQKKNSVVSREELIYNSTHIDDESTLKNIDVLISHIRKKLLQIDPKVKYIHSVRGMGYKLIT